MRNHNQAASQTVSSDGGGYDRFKARSAPEVVSNEIQQTNPLSNCKLLELSYSSISQMAPENCLLPQQEENFSSSSIAAATLMRPLLYQGSQQHFCQLSTQARQSHSCQSTAVRGLSYTQLVEQLPQRSRGLDDGHALGSLTPKVPHSAISSFEAQSRSQRAGYQAALTSGADLNSEGASTCTRNTLPLGAVYCPRL